MSSPSYDSIKFQACHVMGHWKDNDEVPDDECIRGRPFFVLLDEL